MRDKTDYVIIEFSKAVFFFGIVVLSFIALGFYSFLTLEHEGHWLTGMNNQVVWGLPHVFAIFLIIAGNRFAFPDHIYTLSMLLWSRF